MRLRKPCEEHGRYEPHPTFDGNAISVLSAQEIENSKLSGRLAQCRGGEFLPEGALVGNVVAIQDRGLVNGKPYAEPWLVTMCVTSEPEKFTRYVLVALASQVGESE